MTAAIPSATKAIRSAAAASMFTPLALILTLIAVMNSLQALASPWRGTSPFTTIVIAKFVYYLYFLVPAIVIRHHSRRIAFTSATAVWWIFIHLGTLVCSFLLHEALSVAVEALLTGSWPTAALPALLFTTPAVWIEIFAYAIILLAFSLVEAQRVNREHESARRQLESRLTKATLQELRNNIRPRFLINTLHTILTLVRDHRNTDANHVLSLLSDFLRATVYDNDRDEISLGEELRFLRQYIEIEQVRTRPGLTTRFAIPENLAGAVVPNFIFQPIVEECALGIAQADMADAVLSIRAARAGHTLEIEFEIETAATAGLLQAAAGEHSSFALSRERLRQLYGADWSFAIHHSHNSIRVVIGIPYREALTESEGIFIGKAAI